jgi:DUF1016 N-terminal domain
VTPRGKIQVRTHTAAYVRSDATSGGEKVGRRKGAITRSAIALRGYGEIHAGIIELLEAARRAVARSVNAAMTATYWEIGRRIAEFEQAGVERATYGDALIERLAKDLTGRFGRG